MFKLAARFALIMIVTAGIFYLSASHIIAVATLYGNTGLAAVVYPISIDGVILISALTLVATQGSVSKEAKFWARFGRYFGFAATLYANMEHSGYGSFAAIAVNVIPAIALIITMEVTIHSAKAMARTAGRQRTMKARTQNATNSRHLRAVA